MLLVGAEVVSRVRERTAFDPTLPTRATAALAEARSSAALRWAPEELASAEETYRKGMVALRRQEVRLSPLRNMRPVSDTLGQAIDQALAAASAGEQLSAGGRRRAERVMAQVADYMDMLDDLETRATLPREGRVGLASARMGFVEASALLEAGAYGEAETRAQEALGRARSAIEALGSAFLRFADEERVGTWLRWIEETVAWSRDRKAVALVVIKEKNLLEVYDAGRRVASYPADLGSNNLAQKYRQGDRATPEGKYKIQQLKGRGQTRYYRALLLNYPTPEDLRRIQAAKESGIVPAGSGPGALIEIHGEGGRGEDWTNGCVAVTNQQMDALFGLVTVGTPVTIVGGDGSNGSFSSLAERLRRER